MRRCSRISWRCRGAVTSTVLLIALLCACTVPGSAGPEYPDLRRLDFGIFGARPLPEPRNDDERYGRVVEAVRLAEAVVVPADIDAALRYGDAEPLPTPRDLTGIVAAATLPTLSAHHLEAAFTTGGMDDATRSVPLLGQTRALRLSVLEFPANADAAGAAQDIDAADFAVSPDNVAVPSVKYADAHAHWRPTVPTLAATLAHGRFVVTMFIMHPTTDVNAMMTLANATFDAELPLLDRFTATAADRLTTLPLDRDGMLRRMLPADPGKWSYPASILMDDTKIAGWGGFRHTAGIVYGPNGVDQIIRDSKRQHGKRSAGSPEEVAIIDMRFLLRFPDAVLARSYLKKKTQDLAKDYDAIAAPRDVPDSICAQVRQLDPLDVQRAMKFLCFVMDGPYVANVYGGTAELARQRAAAQYALLVQSR